MLMIPSLISRFAVPPRRQIRLAQVLLALGLLLGAGLLEGQAQPKPRVLVLSDIGNEPDDAQSLVRFLLYSNEFDVEGILATTSTWLRDEVQDHQMRAHVRAYGQVRDNLLRHAPGYPSEEDLLSKVKACLPVYGMTGVGEGQGSEGSAHIIRVVDRADERPVWVTVWGGANCLAQALWTVRQTRRPEEVAAFVRKLRVYTISDQDDSGRWLREQFPDLFYIVSPSDQGGADYQRATWVGISGDKFHGNFSGPDFTLVDNPWLAEHVRSHGPLGARYPATEYLMEGDTPSFLNLVPNGLAAHVSPGYGGWGGRYELYQPEGEPRPIWTSAADQVTAPDGNVYTTNHATIWRWRDGYQHDFAARMDWTVAERYEDANHNPAAVLDGTPGVAPVYRVVRPGEAVTASAVGTTDPDGDALTYRWWVYPEAGSYPYDVAVAQAAAPEARLIVPADAAGHTIHVLLEVTDDGTPALKRYRRLVLDVRDTW